MPIKFFHQLFKSKIIQLQFSIFTQWTPPAPIFSLGRIGVLSHCQSGWRTELPAIHFSPSLSVFEKQFFNIFFSPEKISLEVCLWTDVFQRFLCHDSVFNSLMQSFEQKIVDCMGLFALFVEDVFSRRSRHDGSWQGAVPHPWETISPMSA